MDMVETILSETESVIDRQWRNMEFCYELMEQHREMEQYVNECLILASGNKRAINEMYILNEAAFGDKIKGFFEKIKNFFKKIFDKMGAAMSGLFSEQKKYMDKYAYIITKCKWRAGDINDVKDHFKAIARITDAADKSDSAIFNTNSDKYFNQAIPDDSDHYIDLNTFVSAESIDKATIPERLKEEDIRNKQFEDFVSSGYWKDLDGFASAKETDSDGNTNIDATFKTWFSGSKDTVSWSEDEVENGFQTFINATYGGQSYLNKLEKVQSTVTKKMDEASKKMEDYYKTQKDKIMQAVKNTAGDNAAAANNNTAKWSDISKNKKETRDEKGNTTITINYKGRTFSGTSDDEVKTAMTNAGINLENTYLHEMNIDSSSSSKASEVDNKSAKGELTGRGTNDDKKVGEQNDKMTKKTANTATAQNLNNTDMNGKTDDEKSKLAEKAETIIDNDIYNRQMRVNVDVNISRAIANSIFSSFKQLNQDSFTIIKAHVQWYLSNPGAEKETDNQANRVKILDMNAGNKPPEAPKPAEKTGEQPAATT